MRLIDVDVLIKQIMQDKHNIFPTSFWRCKVAEILNHAPTIDNVKHGYWVQKYDDLECWKIVCSHCGNDYFNEMFCDEETILDEMKHCPNCGSRNDSVELWHGFEVEE